MLKISLIAPVLLIIGVECNLLKKKNCILFCIHCLICYIYNYVCYLFIHNDLYAIRFRLKVKSSLGTIETTSLLPIHNRKRVSKCTIPSQIQSFIIKWQTYNNIKKKNYYFSKISWIQRHTPNFCHVIRKKDTKTL